MTDPERPPSIDGQPPQRSMPPPAVHIRQRRFSFVWIIPIIAAVIAIYLGYRTIVQVRLRSNTNGWRSAPSRASTSAPTTAMSSSR